MQQWRQFNLLQAGFFFLWTPVMYQNQWWHRKFTVIKTWGSIGVLKLPSTLGVKPLMPNLWYQTICRQTNNLIGLLPNSLIYHHIRCLPLQSLLFVHFFNYSFLILPLLHSILNYFYTQYHHSSPSLNYSVVWPLNSSASSMDISRPSPSSQLLWCLSHSSTVCHILPYMSSFLNVLDHLSLSIVNVPSSLDLHLTPKSYAISLFLIYLKNCPSCIVLICLPSLLSSVILLPRQQSILPRSSPFYYVLSCPLK